jgi:hypothetical protein
MPLSKIGLLTTLLKSKPCHAFKALKSKRKSSKNYHTAETILKSNRQIVDQGKIDTLSTQLHDCSLSCLGTGTSIRRV